MPRKENRTRSIHLRLSPTERRLVGEAADIAGRPLAEFLREVALDMSRQVILAEQETGR